MVNQMLVLSNTMVTDFWGSVRVREILVEIGWTNYALAAPA
jgi:hypothetical protein